MFKKGGEKKVLEINNSPVIVISDRHEPEQNYNPNN